VTYLTGLGLVASDVGNKEAATKGLAFAACRLHVALIQTPEVTSILDSRRINKPPVSPDSAWQRALAEAMVTIVAHR